MKETVPSVRIYLPGGRSDYVIELDNTVSTHRRQNEYNSRTLFES